MIEIFRYNNKWRIRIVDETFEFKNNNDLSRELQDILNLKITKEPYKGGKK